MNIETFDDARAFSARVHDFLLLREAQHCLPLGLIADLSERPGY